jgi:hypothetical protein
MRQVTVRTVLELECECDCPLKLVNESVPSYVCWNEKCRHFDVVVVPKLQMIVEEDYKALGGG